MTALEYILILFNDCGYDTVKQRAGFMTREFERPVKFADELLSHERSRLIEILKDIKAGKREKLRANWQEERNA